MAARINDRLRSSFFRSIKRQSIHDAWARYAEARTANVADKYMTSALIMASAQGGKHVLVQRLWRYAQRPSPTRLALPPLAASPSQDSANN